MCFEAKFHFEQSMKPQELADLLGKDADPVVNVQGALAQAKREAQADPTNAFAWFNMGTNYVMLKDYRQAAAAFDQARSAGVGLPWPGTASRLPLFDQRCSTGPRLLTVRRRSRRALSIPLPPR